MGAMQPESPDGPSGTTPLSDISESFEGTGPGSRSVAEPESGHISKFPVVGIGASAGGLEALRQLFAHIPDDTGMAFIVIQHLDPGPPEHAHDSAGERPPNACCRGG